jgi:prepilin-type N-terminal cleavage/methylation domain-containing protein
MSPPTRREAFTLLEMLIAIAITAMLVAVAVQAHLGIQRAQTHAAAGLGRDRTAEILLDRLERELQGTILVIKSADEDRLGHPYLFIGADDATEGRAADALHFVTRSPARSGFAQPAPGLALVSYAARSDDDLGLVLLREERPLPRSLATQISLGEGEVVADDLAQFDVRYLGEGEGRWRDRWDSTSISMLDQLPVRLEIAVQLYEQTSEGERIEGPEHRRLFAIPVRPIDIEAQRAFAEESSEGKCITNDDCLAIFESVISISGPKYRELLDLLIDTLDDCYDSGSEFAGALRALGADPDEGCT